MSRLRSRLNNSLNLSSLPLFSEIYCLSLVTVILFKSVIKLLIIADLSIIALTYAFGAKVMQLISIPVSGAQNQPLILAPSSEPVQAGARVLLTCCCPRGSTGSDEGVNLSLGLFYRHQAKILK